MGRNSRADSLDAFVTPYSRSMEFVRRVKIDRVTHKVMLLFKAFGLG